MNLVAFGDHVGTEVIHRLRVILDALHTVVRHLAVARGVVGVEEGESQDGSHDHAHDEIREAVISHTGREYSTCG